MESSSSEEQQPSLTGIPPAEKPRMIVRISAIALKLAYPFMAQKDIRFYLCGINVRPLTENGVMITATDGHRAIIIRDQNGFAESETTCAVLKDGIKHCTEGKHTFDVMSDGSAMISGKVAEPLFIQPGRSVIDGATFPRIENVFDLSGYKEGISGAVNPHYLSSALELAGSFGQVRFFTRDADSPLMFVYGGLPDLDCFGGIMKLHDAFDSLPTWFPKRSSPATLAEV